MSHEASDPRSAVPGDGDELAERIDLPVDALLDWGADPRDAEVELEARTEEALVAAERDEYLDALRRLQADFDNFRKRSMRQQTELLERATEGLCVRLLPALDALDLAIAHVCNQHETSDAATALEQIGSLLRDILAREGVERIDAVGVPFDPTIHDAVGHVPADESAGGGDETEPSTDEKAPGAGLDDEATGPAGAGVKNEADRPADAGEPNVASEPERSVKATDGPTVAQVMRPGYRLKSKVLRPAMVVVRG